MGVRADYSRGSTRIRLYRECPSSPRFGTRISRTRRSCQPRVRCGVDYFTSVRCWSQPPAEAGFHLGPPPGERMPRVVAIILGRWTLWGGASKSWKTPHGMSGMDQTGKLGGGGEFAKQATNWPTANARDADKWNNRPPGSGHNNNLSGATNKLADSRLAIDE